MKHTLTTFIALLAGAAFSQESPTPTATGDWDPQVYHVGEMYPGWIINNDGDTVRGFIKADTRCSIEGIGSSNQNTAAFYLHESDKKPTAKYKPGEIKGYMVADKVYESINYSGGLLKKPNFNLVVQDGKIRIYEWYSTAESYATLRQMSGESWQDFDKRRFETKTLFAKDPTAPVELATLGMQFAKRMPELISDNPDMAKKVENKEKGYKFVNMFEVVTEYNNWAAAQGK